MPQVTFGPGPIVIPAARIDVMTSPADIDQNSQEVIRPRIVVGVDGSPPSMRALAWAAAEAQLRGAILLIVHADWARTAALEALAPGMLTFEQAVLDRALTKARALAPNVQVTGQLYEPPAAEALIEASDGAEMLVVGSRGLSGLKELTMGSVSSECAHHARCPVAIIRPGVADTNSGLVGVSGERGGQFESGH